MTIINECGESLLSGPLPELWFKRNRFFSLVFLNGLTTNSRHILVRRESHKAERFYVKFTFMTYRITKIYEALILHKPLPCK